MFVGSRAENRKGLKINTAARTEQEYHEKRERAKREKNENSLSINGDLIILPNIKN
jgi:hypothetical protein